MSHILLLHWNHKAKKTIQKWLAEGYMGVDTEIKDNNQESHLIVSLTSYPARLKYLHIGIVSLLQQSKKPYKIILWLKEEEFTHKHLLTQEMQDLEQCGLTIEWIPENIRSYAKLIPVMQKYPNALIVTADDDLIYMPQWLETLYSTHLKNPKHIIGLNGLVLIKKNSINLETFHNINQHTNILNKNANIYNNASHNNYLQTGGGVLFPPQSFSKEVFNQDVYMDICKYADDIWFNAMAILNDKKRYIIEPTKDNYYTTIGAVQATGLFKFNIVESRNDTQFKAVFDKYNLYSYID